MATLRQVGTPLDACAAGAAVGLHPNTARVHLDLLCSLGLVKRRAEGGARRGRPRIIYEVAPSAAGPVVGTHGARADSAYRALAHLLDGQVSEFPDAVAAALGASRLWAGTLEGLGRPAEQLSTDEAVDFVAALLGRLGFHPETGPGTGAVRLRRCPFVGTGRDSQPVVCGIHLGMLKATLEHLKLPLAVGRLEQRPGGPCTPCTVYLVPHNGKVEGAPEAALRATGR